MNYLKNINDSILELNLAIKKYSLVCYSFIFASPALISEIIEVLKTNTEILKIPFLANIILFKSYNEQHYEIVITLRPFGKYNALAYCELILSKLQGEVKKKIKNYLKIFTYTKGIHSVYINVYSVLIENSYYGLYKYEELCEYSNLTSFIIIDNIVSTANKFPTIVSTKEAVQYLQVYCNLGHKIDFDSITNSSYKTFTTVRVKYKLHPINCNVHKTKNIATVNLQLSEYTINSVVEVFKHFQTLYYIKLKNNTFIISAEGILNTNWLNYVYMNYYMQGTIQIFLHNNFTMVSNELYKKYKILYLFSILLKDASIYMSGDYNEYNKLWNYIKNKYM